MDDAITTHKHPNPLVRNFFKRKMNLAIKLSDLKKDDIILDFGCGSCQLKKRLKNHNVIGYDITPEHTDVKDYTKIKPTKIFVLDVFEHISKQEIKQILKNFKKMSNSKLITIIPTENWISRKLRKLIGKQERVSDHITTLKEIKELLEQEFKLEKKKNFFTISYIASYTPL